jgi:hypothetical protein
MQLTLEAIEELAARARSGAPVTAHQRESLRSRYEHARSASPALGALVAEAHTQIQHEPAKEALARAWRASPVTIASGLAAESRAIAIETLESVVTLERQDALRHAVWSAASASAMDHFKSARSSVESLRDCAASLSLSPADTLLDRVGLGHTAISSRLFDAILTATDGAFDELDPWALRECELGERAIDARRRTLSFDDRLRSLAQPRASAHVPLGDRSAASARWIARVGLGGALARVLDKSESSRADATRIRVRVEREGVRVVLSGEEDPTVLGGARLAARWGEALAYALPQEPSTRGRAGLDRLHVAVAGALAKWLCCERSFVTRELGVDPAQSAAVERAALHGLLCELRRSCAEVSFARAALNALPELATRLRDAYTRALSSSIEPAWASHIGAATLERRAEASCIGALIEPVLRERLRERYDEDWFRNPRAGEGLANELAALRGLGSVAWLRAAVGAETDEDAITRASSALRARVSERFERATR